MRQILIIVAISVILGLSVAVVFNMTSGSKPSTSSKETKSYNISLTDQLLMKIDKRLERIQEDLAKIKEELTGSTKNNF